ncbi:MAG: hypothetical protein Q8871_02695, partial [Pigeon pea little leaf phytoplasma]|nr:hypothetical protein [Pigeon pea little leaf phytoplasma]
MGFSSGISFDITNLIFKDQYLSIKNIIDYGFNNKITNQINTYFEYKIHDYFEDKISLINNLKNTEFIIKFGIDRYFGIDNLEKYENFLNTNMTEILDFSKFFILDKSFIIDRNSSYKQILDYHKIKEFLNKISDKILEKFNIKYELQNDLNQIFNNDNNQIKIDNCKQIELFLNKISEDITKSNCVEIESFLNRNFEEILTNNNISDYDQKKHFNKCLNCLICQTKEFLFNRILDIGNLMKIQIKDFFVNKVWEIRNLLKKDQNDIINCQSKENLNNEYIELFPFSLSVCKDLMVNGKCIVFDDIIFCRDEIMNYLISKGLKKLVSFEIMELVRKGKQNYDRQRWSDLSKIMREHNVNDWYIESLQKIQYLFPKP